MQCALQRPALSGRTGLLQRRQRGAAPLASRRYQCAAPTVAAQAAPQRPLAPCRAAAGPADPAPERKPTDSSSAADEKLPAAAAAAAAAADSSKDAGADAAGQQQQEQEQQQQPKKGGLVGWFESLPQKTQVTIGAVVFAVVMFGLPFLQPTSIYGDTSAAHQAATQVAQEQPAKPARHIPVITPAMNMLQEFAMPRTLPDGRTESPGVIRIYLASMIILAAFYACSAVLQLILNGVLAVLRATGVIKGNRGDSSSGALQS